jgi:uncharacterized protein with PQ loop repeat
MKLYQSLGRYKKPKGSNIKLVLMMMIILAVCVWLLYQIKHVEIKNYDGQTKIVVGRGIKLFGKKGILCHDWKKKGRRRKKKLGL